MAKLTTLNHDWIHRFLQAYSDFAGQPFRARALSAGTVNTIYKIRFLKLKKNVYLKIDEACQKQRLQNEFFLLQTLQTQNAKLGFATPHPIAQSNGRLSSPLGRKRVYLLPEVPGSSLQPQRLQPNHFRELGRKMRALHALRAPRQAFPHKWNISQLQRLYKNLKPQIEPKDKSLSQFLWQTLQRLKTCTAPTPLCWIHGDAFFDNLHWQGNRLVGILDFEYAGSGNPLYDVAMALLALAWSGRSLNKRKCDAFWRSYRTQIIDPASWRMAFEHASLTIVLTRLMTFEFGPLKNLRIGRRDYRDFLKRLKWSQSFDFKVFF